MKHRITPIFLLLLLLYVAACSEGEEATLIPTVAATPTVALPTATPTPTYDLDWNIPNRSILAYHTAMNAVDSPMIELNLDVLMAGNETSELAEQIGEIALPDSFALVTVLKGIPDDKITVLMIVDEIEVPEAEADNPLAAGVNSLMNQMAGTVQLRGEVTREGAISSFFMEQNQKNLLALFFELPVGPVAVGDSWSLDVNCIQMGNGFIAEATQRRNEVTLTEVSQNEAGQTVAILDYVIAESVDGVFAIPGGDELAPAAMTCTFLGQGEFLIDEGRWSQFSGEFALQSSGVMEANGVQQFALTLMDDVPPQYVDLR